MPLSITTADEVASRWNASQRTVYRWHARGVDVTNPAAVLDLILSLKNPTLRMLDAAAREAVAINEAEIKRITAEP